MGPILFMPMVLGGAFAIISIVHSRQMVPLDTLSIGDTTYGIYLSAPRTTHSLNEVTITTNLYVDFSKTQSVAFRPLTLLQTRARQLPLPSPSCKLVS
jgi:hypothetical protein